MVRAITNLTQGVFRVGEFARDVTRQKSLRAQAGRLPDTGETAEVSTESTRLRGLAGSTPIRTELVERLRREIAAGSYLTPHKLEVAAQRLQEQMLCN